jgi:hypothetical protein
MLKEKLNIKTIEFSRSVSPPPTRRPLLNTSIKKHSKPILFQNFAIEEKVIQNLVQSIKLRPSLNISNYGTVIQALYNQKLKESPLKKTPKSISVTFYAPSSRTASPLKPKLNQKKCIKPLSHFKPSIDYMKIDVRPLSRMNMSSKSNSPEPKLMKSSVQQT